MSENGSPRFSLNFNDWISIALYAFYLGMTALLTNIDLLKEVLTQNLGLPLSLFICGMLAVVAKKFTSDYSGK